MAEIRRELMKKQRQLTSLTLIKNEAVQIELILEEKRENQPLVQMELMVIQSLLIKLWIKKPIKLRPLETTTDLNKTVNQGNKPNQQK